MPVGIDVVAIERVAEDVRRWGDTFLDRALTPAEKAWCRAGVDVATAVAACLAAKEAVVKVLGGRPKGFSWRGVELVPNGEAGEFGAARVLLDEARASGGGTVVVGRWHSLVDGAVDGSIAGAVIEVVAVTRATHVLAVAATVAIG